MTASPLPPGQLVPPDFGDYFERRTASRVAGWMEPKLIMESARGCWWGEKHHCTFCGLNGTLMQFRSKAASTFVDELLALVHRHRILDAFIVDNILDMQYLSSALPQLRDAGYDLRLHYEIKSNLRQDQLRTLRSAGITHVQPGIENLHSNVLKLMDKGVTGVANVRLLRDCETEGLFPVWNYLYGFPGETDAQYTDVIRQLPALHHLAPPGGAVRVEIERFSPYFNRPELGFSELRPSSHYRLVYDLPDAELRDFAYVFDAPPRGIDDALGAVLRQALQEWTDRHLSSRLTCCSTDEGLVLVNTRPHFPWRTLYVRDPFEIEAFRLLAAPRNPAGLAGALAEAGMPAPVERTEALLRRWEDLGLLFTESGRWIHVVPDATNQDLIRRRHLDRNAHQPEPLPA